MKVYPVNSVLCFLQDFAPGEYFATMYNSVVCEYAVIIVSTNCKLVGVKLLCLGFRGRQIYQHYNLESHCKESLLQQAQLYQL